ncbi:MAG: DUF3683 domain-containing protein [Desulfobacterales bacterium]|nr:DUF3683 domain-containing protein [Desulfobacterales bacterium]
MHPEPYREILYNYTSASDPQIVKSLFGQKIWNALERLRFQRKTGRLGRLIHRVIGDIFFLSRNPFIYQELSDTISKRNQFFGMLRNDLSIIAKHAQLNPNIDEIHVTLSQTLHHLWHNLLTLNARRLHLRKALGEIIGENNVCFDPFTIISHATDATDWRLHLPLAVLFPNNENEIVRLIPIIHDLGLYVIPRGGGTGLTGGAVPVHKDTLVINMEKFNHIEGIQYHHVAGHEKSIPVLHLQPGVITETAMHYASQQKLIFATDPTSAWSCTIGGNIAENAGGKSAVLWGTAIDNLFSYRIVTPSGEIFEVKRLHHPYRKIRPDDVVIFEIYDHSGQLLNQIELKGTEIRKKGLGKDITNKVLNGLPGVQKEGCDGIITDAGFVLYPRYPHKVTACLEFYGVDMDEAGRVILSISTEFVYQDEEALLALEHFDEEYVRAIGYKNKAPRQESPMAVLLIDIVGHTLEQVNRGKDRLIRLLESYPNTYAFFAKDEAEATRFWLDRKKLGAIAARTNAFKLNEDIVLPLEELASFSRFVDQYNTEENRHNQRTLIYEISSYLDKLAESKDHEWLSFKIPRAQELLNQAMEKVSFSGKFHLREETHIHHVCEELYELFRGYQDVCDNIDAIYKETRKHLIVIATHMHAGDGNVHVNIPVFSNHREMMQRASETADQVMMKAVELDGVVSGEHGIGFTKLKYLDQDIIDELDAYRKQIDPRGMMNPKKLSDLSVVDQVFTQSFELIGLEAHILQYTGLEELLKRITSCIRCGRCKSNCCVFYPEENLFYHPRNKNLALSSLIEAILYEAQRFQKPSDRLLAYLNDIAAHCTICHKCYSPCPVRIDSGDITILEREFLIDQKVYQPKFLTQMTLSYLENRSFRHNQIWRLGLVQTGSALQRIGNRVLSMFHESPAYHRLPYSTYLHSKVPPVPKESIFTYLPKTKPNQALMLKPETETQHTVFYFPGCGSERLFSTVALAALYCLLATGNTVIMPPQFLCCGFPFYSNGQKKRYETITLRNVIVFHQIRQMLSYVTFDACLISCGTCRESLERVQLSDIFNAKIEDVSRFVLAQQLTISIHTPCFYHPPCHDSLDGDGKQILKDLTDKPVTVVPDCCSESGTLSLSRPDISHAMLKRKRLRFEESGITTNRNIKLLTNCPSCLQGLGRNVWPKYTPQHIIEAIAESHGGVTWKQKLHEMLCRAEYVTF